MNKLTVFVSSTSKDLIEERKSVFKAILGLDCRPIGMEAFGAADSPPWQGIQKQIADADACILILAGKYGSVDATGKSYTEKEHDYAKELGKPVLRFLYDKIENLPGLKLEKSSTPSWEKLRKFRDRCRQNLCAFYETPNELEAIVTRSLAKLLQHRYGVVTGRVQGFTSDGILEGRSSNIGKEVQFKNANGKTAFYARELLIPKPGIQTLLSWSEFGFGVESMMKQIRSIPLRVRVEGLIGINEAGLAIASFLSGALMHREPIGLLRRDRSGSLSAEFLPEIRDGGSLLLVDSEIKSGKTLLEAMSVLNADTRELRIFFSALGAQAVGSRIPDELTAEDLDCASALNRAKLLGFCFPFIAPSPSLEPPLYLE